MMSISDDKQADIIYFCKHLEEDENAGCFAIIALKMYCYCQCSVALPCGDVAWSAVCDCGNS